MKRKTAKKFRIFPSYRVAQKQEIVAFKPVITFLSMRKPLLVNFFGTEPEAEKNAAITGEVLKIQVKIEHPVREVVGK